MQISIPMLPAGCCLVLLAAACAALSGSPQDPAPGPAYAVEIVRDTFGVPHIYGATDAAVVFGAAYAQAEDNWWQVEDNLLRSIGRGAEVHGPSAYVDDYLVRAMEIPRLSRQEYEQATPAMRAMYEAYAAGFNHYLATHAQTRVRLLSKIEPWYTLAMIRFKYHHNEYLGYAGLERQDTERLLAHAEVQRSADSHVGKAEFDAGFRGLDASASLAFQVELSPNGERALGSNQVALSGQHTASGAAMLLINPHVSFFGLSQYWEVHLVSAEGLEFSGQGRFGFMLPYMGHSSFLGWGYTDNYSDIGDLYVEHFDKAAAPLEYRYDSAWRSATEWSETIGVLDSAGVVQPKLATFRKTHHGPIVGRRAGADGVERPLAAKVAKLEQGGWFAQWHGQMLAKSLEDWKRAASVLSVAYQNTMYADRDGNILYLYNAAVPRRAEGFNWREPVDGSDPGTEWAGYHGLEELPQFLNPSSGWLQNTNSDALRATTGLVRQRADYPAYMLGRETHNARAVSATRLLQGLAQGGECTFAEFCVAILDTHLSQADERIPELLAEYSRLQATDPERAERLREPMAELSSWNREASTSSVATTLFVGWATASRTTDQERSDRFPRLAALELAVQQLVTAWGTWKQPWGKLNRAQRPDASGVLPFDNGLPSVAVAGAPGWLGSFFTFHTRPAPEGHIGYGVHGNSFVKAIAFGEQIQAASILTFGSSADPSSAHYFDQAELYGQKKLKPAWFSRQAVEAHSARSYLVRTH